ncbi:MAG: hypothetical protein WAN43_03530 [Rhodomicrobium sp.]|jgi:hypothetical protein
MEASKWGKSFGTRAVLAIGAAVALTGAALAGIEEDNAKIASCGKALCAIIVSKDANGPDVSCDLTKTWEKDEIQKGADSKKISWGLGSAQCKVKVSVKRAAIVSAISAPEDTFKFDKQSVACEIGSEKYEIRATIAPELKFKDGATTAVSLHINNIEGAALIKGVVWTAATLESTFGILQKDLIREVNKFINKECPRMLSESK